MPVGRREVILNNNIISDKAIRKSFWRYLESNIVVYDCLKTNSLSRIKTFFDTHFIIENASENELEDAIANIVFFDYGELEKYFPGCKELARTHFVIRNSKTSKFKLAANEVTYDNYKLFLYDEIDNAVAIYGNYAYVFMSEESEVAVIELIRDIVSKDQVNRGKVYLHASAVEKNDVAYIICGNGGAGKTTTLLELVNKHNYRFMSGDKVVFSFEKNKLLVHGWPDYPNLGVGTIKRYDSLVQIAPEIIGDLKNTDKILFDFEVFYKQKNMCPYKGKIELGGFFFPNIIFDSCETVIKKITDVKDIFCRNLEFKEDYETRNWQSIVVPNYDRKENIFNISKHLKNVIGYEVTGNLSNIGEGLFDEMFIKN